MLLLTQEDRQYQYFTEYIEEIPVCFMKDKATGEILADGDDLARALGWKNMDDMMSDDFVLNEWNKFKAQYPDEPFPIELIRR